MHTDWPLTAQVVLYSINHMPLGLRRICKSRQVRRRCKLENKLTEVIDQTGLNMLIFGADEVDVSNITPFIIYLFESPSLNG